MRKLFIIGEVGINHSGNIDDALNLIDMAKECGCDAVKFQKRTIDIVYSKEEQEKYRESPWGTTNGAQKRGLEFDKKEYDIIDEYCKKVGIEWFASAWDIPALEFISQYDCGLNKIASAMVTNRDFCEAVVKQGKFTYISTGMCSIEDIDKIVTLFEGYNCPFSLMHAISIYPCDDSDCNLLTIKALEARYGRPVGYSGHERGILPSVLAVALGATAIERHITLDRSSYGSDQSASLEKHGLELLVRDCREVYSILGHGKKVIFPKEHECASKLRYWDA